jgi:hypothetical protein
MARRPGSVVTGADGAADAVEKARLGRAVGVGLADTGDARSG